MVHPPSQSVTANEGEPLDIVVEFCARPSYTKVFWISEEHVYTPDAPSRDGVRALAIEVNLHVSLYQVLLACYLRAFIRVPCSHEGAREIHITLIHLVSRIALI
ncbi:hypothetical protein P5V15_003522 [Pogonomyrmex californicus]